MENKPGSNLDLVFNKGKRWRDNEIRYVRNILDAVAVPPPTMHPYYGYLLMNTTVAKYKPWEAKSASYKKYETALSDQKLFNIEQFAKMAPGGIAYECGVYTGGCTRMLLDMGREVVAFDTFDGIVGSDKLYDDFVDGEYCADNPDMVKEYISGAEIVEGDIRKTIIERPMEGIAFAHIDLDVYEPTQVALDYIYHNIMRKGVIVIDDYGVWCTKGVKQAVDEFTEMHKINGIYLPTGQMVIIR